jgi:hypothetical protein
VTPAIQKRGSMLLHHRRLNVSIAFVVILTACAHLPWKERAVRTLQATHIAISNAQDFENNAYNARLIPSLSAPASASFRAKCPADHQLAANPTNHNVINCLFSVAFGDEVKAGNALRAWRAGDPPPASLAELNRDADDILGLVKSVAPQSTDFVSKAQAILDEVLKVVAIVKGGQ